MPATEESREDAGKGQKEEEKDEGVQTLAELRIGAVASPRKISKRQHHR